MASLAELMVKVGADISEFTKNMQQVEKTMSTTGQGLMNIGQSVGNAGQSMAQSVSLPIMALATSAVVVGASFDKQMSKVMAISGATGTEFDKLRQQALELGSSTTFSSSEVAMAMEELASAGFNTNQILASTSGVLSLASSAGIGLAEASAIAGSAINGFGLEAEDAGRVSDVLAKASAISATNATGLGEAFKYVAPVASMMGHSIEETASAIGLMANAGIDGSQAGTTLRMGLLKLASPTKEMKELMAETGSEFFDANGKMKSMSGIIDTLATATADMKDEQKAHYLSTLFGAEAVSGFMTLLEAGTGKLDENTDALKNSSGEAEKMAKTMNDNLAGAWNELTGALEALAISFSDVMKGDLRVMTEAITELMNRFNGLSPATKKFIVIGGLLLASLAPLLIVIGLVAQGIGAVMIAFGAITAPVLAVIALVALIGVAFYTLWTKSETFREGVIGVFNAIKEKVTQAIGIVVSFLKEKLAQLQAFWNENGTQILKAVENVWNGILAVVNFVMPVILWVVKMVWESIKGIIDGVLNFIMGLVKVFAGLFTGDFKKMWEGVKQMFFGAVQAIWNYLNLLFIGRILKGIGAFFKVIGGMFKTWGTNTVSFFKGMWDGMWKLVDDFCEAVQTLFKMFKKRGASTFQAFWGIVKSIWTSIGNGIKSIASGIKDGAIASFKFLKSSVKSIFNGIKNLITNPIETAKNTVLKIIDAIVGAFKAMKITIPKPKLPKVSVSMKKGMMGIPYPDFDISWNAKGAIFNGASVLGGGQGVGEKGAEAVVPIQHKRYMRPFASAVAQHMDSLTGSNDKEVIVQNTVHTTIELDGEVVGRKVEKYVSREQLNRQKRTNRGGGR